MTFKDIFKKAKESNIVRFLAGIAIFFLSLAILGVLLIVLFPVLLVSTVIVSVILLAILAIAFIIGLFTAIWHVSKKEENIVDKTKKEHNDYSNNSIKNK